MRARSSTRGRKPRTPRSIDRASSVILPVLRSGGRGDSPATRPQLNYERLASRHQCGGGQRLQATTTRSQSRQAARVWRQNRLVCALRPSLVSMVTGCRAGRACGPAGVFASAVPAGRAGKFAQPGSERAAGFHSCAFRDRLAGPRWRARPRPWQGTRHPRSPRRTAVRQRRPLTATRVASAGP